MIDEPVLIDRTHAVTTITLNRPERRNALTLEIKEALRDAVAEAARDPQARAVILTGSGAAFSVGQDLAEHAEALTGGAEEAFSTIRDHYSPVVRDLMTMPKPVVAAVQGACVGAGLGLILACDYRVYGEGIKLATAFTGIGLTFDSGLSWSLPRAVGEARARELMLLGRSFDAREAIAWGVAGEVVDPSEVLNRAVVLARQLANGPTTAYAESKRLLHGTLDDLEVALEEEAAAQTLCGKTDDHARAVRAFLTRQSPSFIGR